MYLLSTIKYPIKTESALSLLRESYPTILIQRSSEDPYLNPTGLPNSPRETLRFTETENPTPYASRHALTKAQIAKLQEAFPKCRITRNPKK